MRCLLLLAKFDFKQCDKIDEIVKQAVNRIEGLNNQAQEIIQLVKVITEIAD